MTNFLKTIIVLLALCQSHYVSGENSLRQDTLSERRITDPYEYRFRPSQLIVPGALIVTGTLGVYENNFRKASDNVTGNTSSLRKDRHFKADDFLQALPGASYVVLGSVGIQSKHRFRERVAAGLTACLIMGTLVRTGKSIVRQKRPDSDARNSFPSGHTATAFTGAELIRMEYPVGIGIAAYTVAGGVAFLRLYNGRHRLNEVIAGAGIGILSARAGYWMLPVYRRWFGWDKNKHETSMVMMPVYYSGQRAPGICMSVTF